ncbi:hypothetical protein BH11PSE3_BH11PSE3_00610 [soil metagenome]
MPPRYAHAIVDVIRRGQFGGRTRLIVPAYAQTPTWRCTLKSNVRQRELARTQIKPDERKQSAVAFLKAAVAYFASLGVVIERVMTDNGSCYRSVDFRNACRELRIKHIRTRPYTPKTNGKAERFVQTCLREWAYARAYLNSGQRADELPFFMHRYNWHRPHAGIGAKPPISRLALAEDNLLRLHN